MLLVTVLHPQGVAEYDLTAGTCVVRDVEGNALVEPRAITESERQQLDSNYLSRQIESLNEAVNQLILDALMGGL